MFGAQGSPPRTQGSRRRPSLPELRQQQAGISAATSAQNRSKNFFERRNFGRSQESAPRQTSPKLNTDEGRLAGPEPRAPGPGGSGPAHYRPSFVGECPPPRKARRCPLYQLSYFHIELLLTSRTFAEKPEELFRTSEHRVSPEEGGGAGREG